MRELLHLITSAEWFLFYLIKKSYHERTLDLISSVESVILFTGHQQFTITVLSRYGN